MFVCQQDTFLTQAVGETLALSEGFLKNKVICMNPRPIKNQIDIPRVVN